MWVLVGHPQSPGSAVAVARRHTHQQHPNVVCSQLKSGLSMNGVCVCVCVCGAPLRPTASLQVHTTTLCFLSFNSFVATAGPRPTRRTPWPVVDDNQWGDGSLASNLRSSHP